ncbi:DNA cytosine methyltransferase [Leucobacter coleopterorum]|uniref:DNA (cytosine-5-)-methyltransferase n=1 Tax=Leucobacter coleopterorum TaxID=2714933 RepID=A0ABX6JYN5_9MICO|nr:DNA cytosine methyltransferase [Leucobacter coleopterorum]
MKVIDLFAGAGGLSLGAARAGFEVAASVEIDRAALATHRRNFPGTKHLDLDIAKLSGETLLCESGVSAGQLTGLIGGPPCQGFSTMGKQDVSDSRNDLFQHFFRLVSETKPTFFIAENVRGILQPQYDSIRERAFSLVRDDYKLLPALEVSANQWGAPTSRKRVFFVGVAKNAPWTLDAADFALACNAVEEVRVAEALQGLPDKIDPSWQKYEDSWQARSALTMDSEFLKRVQGMIPRGVGHPEDLYRYHDRGEVSGNFGTRHSATVEARYAALAPGEKDQISKSVRLNTEGFCPTLRAGTGSDKGNFQAVRPIHPCEPRVITVREAARLQGFPDWFTFHTSKHQSFRQIGNSVSPLVAERTMSLIYKKARQAPVPSMDAGSTRS